MNISSPTAFSPAQVSQVNTPKVGVSKELLGALIGVSQQKLYVDASVKALSIANDAVASAVGNLIDTHA